MADDWLAAKPGMQGNPSYNIVLRSTDTCTFYLNPLNSLSSTVFQNTQTMDGRNVGDKGKRGFPIQFARRFGRT